MSDEEIRRLEREVAGGDNSRHTLARLMFEKARAGRDVWFVIYGKRHKVGADCTAGRCGRTRKPLPCARCKGRVHAGSTTRGGNLRIRRRCEECGHVTDRTEANGPSGSTGGRNPLLQVIARPRREGLYD